MNQVYAWWTGDCVDKWCRAGRRVNVGILAVPAVDGADWLRSAILPTDLLLVLL
ncbi:MAG: hypothetical protein WC052_04070 [Patescibacteria group bacterium]